jgi:membrane-bound ClpP family serine protease
MKRKIRKFYQAVIAELTEHKNTFFVYFGLRLLVLGILILQIFHQNYENAFLCILTLILMIIPSVIQATLKVEFPSPLEIIVLIFIFSAKILGEIRSFYMRFLYWDTVLHTLNGFLCAAIGFSLVDIMNRQRKMKIARHFNSGGIHSQEMRKAIDQSVARIYEMKYEVLKMAGDFHSAAGGSLDGNTETHSK